MKINIESTGMIVDLPADMRQARVWEGTTEGGVKCFLLIPRVSVHKNDDNTQFEKELTETPHKSMPPTFSLRQIL